MDFILAVDWERVFRPQASLLEILVRGSVIYLVLLILLRIAPRRTLGGLSVMDILVIVLVAEGASNAIHADYTSVTDGILLVMVLVAWSCFLDWLTYKSPAIDRLVSPRPLPLIRNGQVLRRNLKIEFLTQEELMQALRHQGIDKVEEVKSAHVEGDGSITAIKLNGDAKPDADKQSRRKRAGM